MDCIVEPQLSSTSVINSEEVGHDFRGMQVKLLRAIGKALFLLTQRVDLGCGDVYYSLWQMHFN